MIHCSKVRIRSESNELDNFNFHELYAYLVAFFFLTVNRVFQHKDYSGKIHKTLILNCSQRCFSVGKNPYLRIFTFCNPIVIILNQIIRSVVHVSISIKQLAGNVLFVLQYSLRCAKAPNGIISVEFIEWERTNRKLHTFIFLIVTWDQIL